MTENKGTSLAAQIREANSGGVVMLIPAEHIKPNPLNFYEMSDLEELATSIETVGQLEPIKVKPDPEDERDYMIVDGERRFRAMTEVLDRDAVRALIVTPVDEITEELMLIEANRTQRKLSAADLSKQAKRYTELLSRLKDSGVQIPGRLRDRVAEALQVSSAKLGRLHAIRKNLVPGLLDKFDRNVINESVAYEFSKQPEAFQTAAAEYPDYHLAKFTADDVPSFFHAWSGSIEAKKAGIKAPEPEPVTESNTGTSWDANAYLKQRQDEDDDFYLMLGLEADHFLAQLAWVKDRQDGIQTLKEHFGRHHTGWFYDEVCVNCSAKGLELGCEDRAIPFIERTWTDVYDMLCRFVMTGAARLPRTNVSESNGAPAGIVWHDTLQDGPPAHSTRNVICWTSKGELYKPIDVMLTEEFELGAETSCRWWAAVEGPEV